MMAMLKEFSVRCAGVCFVMALDNPETQSIEGARALMLLEGVKDGEPARVRVADWVK